jgi:predicted acylesterase/phospholipase RssA
VIRALQELAIPIDFVGGTSMGAVIAAQLASGWTVDEMLERNYRFWVTNKPLQDFTLPISSVIRGKRVRKMLQDMFGTTLMENLWLNLFCVSANLTRRKLAVHKSGLMWRRIGASLSIPGFGPPCIIDGELHVDGALINNLPVDVMKSLYRCRVVAVDVSQNAALSAPTGVDHYPTGVEQLFGRFNDVARIPDIIWRSMTLGSDRKLKQTEHLAEQIITPPVKNYASFKFGALRNIADKAYLYTLEKRDVLSRLPANIN